MSDQGLDEILRGPATSETKIEALRAALDRKDPGAIVPVRACLAGERDPRVQEAMVEVLGELGDVSDWAILVAQLHGVESCVATSALQALRKLEIEPSLPVLMGFARRCGGFDELSGLLADRESEAVDMVAQSFRQARPTLRTALAGLLGQLGHHPGANELLLQTLRVEQSERVVRSICQALRGTAKRGQAGDMVGPLRVMAQRSEGAKAALIEELLRDLSPGPPAPPRDPAPPDEAGPPDCPVEEALAPGSGVHRQADRPASGQVSVPGMPRPQPAQEPASQGFSGLAHASGSWARDAGVQKSPRRAACGGDDGRRLRIAGVAAAACVLAGFLWTRSPSRDGGRPRLPVNDRPGATAPTRPTGSRGASAPRPERGNLAIHPPRRPVGSPGDAVEARARVTCISEGQVILVGDGRCFVIDQDTADPCRIGDTLYLRGKILGIRGMLAHVERKKR